MSCDTLEVIVPGAHCAGCISKIETGMKALRGVLHARVNLSEKRLQVSWDKSLVTPDEIKDCLTGLGFDYMPFDGEPVENKDKTGQHLLIALAVAGFAAANVMLLSVSVWSGADEETAKLFQLLSALIALPAALFAGRPFYNSAFRALRVGTLNMDVPISLAVILSLAISLFEVITGTGETYFDAAITLLFFLLAGRYLDHQSRQKALGAIGRLARLASKEAIQLDSNGRKRQIASDDICAGMSLLIPAGERLPVNAVLISEQGEFNKALVSGESKPVLLLKDAVLEAGVLNLISPVVVKAVGDTTNSFLAEVSALIEAAQQRKGTYVRIADRFAKLYAPIVHLAAGLTFLFWVVLMQIDVRSALWIAVTVLIITCPCALALAVPVAQVIAAKVLFSNGIMIKDGGAIERLCEIDTVVFDKTGTLTLSIPAVNKAIGDLKDHSTLLALTRISTHPAAIGIGHFIANEFDNTNTLQKLQNVKEFAGDGVEATTFSGDTVRLGRPSWVQELCDVNSVKRIDNKSDDGTSFIDGSGNLIRFCFVEELQKNANECLVELELQKLDVRIISGDSKQAVQSVVSSVGSPQFSYGQRPEQKIEEINQIQAENHKVLMVGDGINDAPSLAAAYVSMAPAEASSISRASADIVYVRPDLMSIPFARKMAKATQRIVKQNFAIALLYNCIAIPLAIAGFVTPLIAAIAMSTSSLLVVANSMRLNLIKGTSLAETEL